MYNRVYMIHLHALLNVMESDHYQMTICTSCVHSMPCHLVGIVYYVANLYIEKLRA